MLQALVVVALCSTWALAQSAEVLALVTESGPEAQIKRQAGGVEAAVAGSRLVAGDEVRALKGEVGLIYLSGRLIKLAEGDKHAVTPETSTPAPLVVRLKETLEEIDQSTGKEPTVHGMARSLGQINGARPANTWVSGTDFSFSWDGEEGRDRYEFSLETSEGKALRRVVVKGHTLAAKGLDLERGRRYLWSVSDAQGFVPRNTGTHWLEVAGDQAAKEIGVTLAEIAKVYQGETQSLLQAAALYRAGYYHEAVVSLESQQAKRALSVAERSLLAKARSSMAP